jgi:prepilin-type N-terminal cleavage/methylation domain-containing protein
MPADEDSMRLSTSKGFSLIELAAALFILAIITAVLVPIAGSLIDASRANETIAEMSRIYTAVVGDPSKNAYGYIGDTGQFPSSLLDLVQAPASTPGWDGPYLTDARVQNGVVYDPYGSPYECYYYPDNTASTADQFVIMSRGPDRSSTNGAANNLCTKYGGPAGTAMPANYAQSGVDADNVVYPRFTDNSSLLKYNHLGTLAINIMNFDQNALVNALVPGCPLMYSIAITSVARGSSDTFTMLSNPGANVVDLPQGLYKVSITSPTATTALWQEQVAVTAGATVSRMVNIYTGVNSSQTPNQSFTPLNNYGSTIAFSQFTTSLGGTVSNGNSGNFTAKPCAQEFVRDNATSAVIDAFTFPYFQSAPFAPPYSRRINTSTLCIVTVSNLSSPNPNRTQIFVTDMQLLIGVVGNRGSGKVKTFSVRTGNSVKIYDMTGGQLGSSTLVSCPTTTVPSIGP